MSPAERVLTTATPEWVCDDPLCACGGVDSDYPRDTLGGLFRVVSSVVGDDLPPHVVSPHLFERESS